MEEYQSLSGYELLVTHLTEMEASVAASTAVKTLTPARTYTTGPCGLASPDTISRMLCARLPK